MSLNTDARHAVVQRERHICPTCRGTGDVMVAYAGYPADSPFVACPDCDGPAPRSLDVTDNGYEPFDVDSFEL